MLLTCPRCETAYKLDDDRLGAIGRMVRCTECKHTWFQPAGEVQAIHIGEHGREDIHRPVEALLADDADLMERVLGQSGSFADLVQENMAQERTAIPETVKPGSDIVKIVEHKPWGMTAGQAGASVFLLLSFFTLSLLFAARVPLTQHVPAFAPVYALLGMPVEAPGEGLRISNLQAESKAGQGSRTLSVKAQLDNMTDHEKPVPALTAVAKGPYGATLKEWAISVEDKTIPAGGHVAIADSWEKADPAAAKIELKVGGK